MKILAEKDDLLLAQHPDEMHALGEIMALSTLDARAGAEAVFSAVERAHAHVAQKCYALLHARGAPDAPVTTPVGFIFWAQLSLPMEIIFYERFRPLGPHELRSGRRFWITQAVTPFGGFSWAQDEIGRLHPEADVLRRVRRGKGKVERVEWPNPHHAKETDDG